MKKQGGAGVRGARNNGRRAVSKRKTQSPPAAPRRKQATDASKATVRRLKNELARALARIEELQTSAETDFLLGIPNRRGFERELQRAVSYINRYRGSGALIVLDVDRLKPINDAFGHSAGDEVLKAIADALTRQVRSSDVVGRLGGDEFALLLWNLTETDARAKAAVLEAAIDELTSRTVHAYFTGRVAERMGASVTVTAPAPGQVVFTAVAGKGP